MCVCGVWAGGGGGGDQGEEDEGGCTQIKVFHPILFWSINRLEVDKVGPVG